MRIHIIDRNIVSKISSNFKNCKKEEINFIKSLDKKGNSISLLLANLEGRSGIPQNMNQSSLGLYLEGDIIKKFFKKATVDSTFFEIFNDLASWGITHHQKDVFSKYSEIISYLKEKLHQPYSLQQAKKVRDEIVDYASERKVDIGSPIVLCGLATLYGNKNALNVSKVGKPKDDDKKKKADIYNSLSDLMVIVNLAEVAAMAKRNGINMQINFATLDMPLRNFLKEIGILDVVKSRFTLVNESIITLDFNMSLFPKINGNDVEEFKEWINAKKQEDQN